MREEFFADHLSIRQYGSFLLTNAIRPGPSLPIRPREGYRVRVYRDVNAGLKLPMLSAAISAEKVFDVFTEMLPLIGETVNVVLETSHGRDADQHLDYRRNYIDVPVLLSHFCDFEDLLMNDGCTGVAVMNTSTPLEIQFDEHKVLHVYARNLKPFRRILRDHGIRRRVNLPLLSEGEHLHHTTDEYEQEFEQLCLRVGVGDFDRVFSDEELSE